MDGKGRAEAISRSMQQLAGAVQGRFTVVDEAW